MRLWNLSDLSDLSEVVVDESPAAMLGRKRRLGSPASRVERFKVLAGVATAAISLTLGMATVNNSTVRLPNWSAAIARTAPSFKPPLEGMFVGRFNSEWTEANEQSLLSQIEENRLTKKTRDSAADVAYFVFSNQQESISLETPRLSLDTIQQLVRKRKSS
jgi:hypothetical protein